MTFSRSSNRVLNSYSTGTSRHYFSRLRKPDGYEVGQASVDRYRFSVFKQPLQRILAGLLKCWNVAFPSVNCAD